MKITHDEESWVMHDENEKGILLCMQNSGREMTHEVSK